jgi:hypothetical protein
VATKRKINANRTNARASTGPKTKTGRAHSSRNALRHALSLPVFSDPVLSEEVEMLAREIAGRGASVEVQELARRIAETQVDLCRVRQARHELLSHEWADPYYDSQANVRAKLKLIGTFLRPKPPSVPLETLAGYVGSVPQGPEKLAMILADVSQRLLAMDRYERRALSRRKFAMRALERALLRRDATSFS